MKSKSLSAPRQLGHFHWRGVSSKTSRAGCVETPEAGKTCASPQDLLKPGRKCQLLSVLVLSRNELANRHVPK